MSDLGEANEWIRLTNRIKELEAALSGRTVSCSNCNQMAASRDRWREVAEKMADALKEIYLELDASCDTGWEPDMKKIREVVAAYDSALQEPDR